MTQEIRCLEDLDELGAEITDPLEALFQDNFHRIIDPPGSNIDDPGWGFGLAKRLSGSNAQIDTIEGEIETELKKDPLNAQVRVIRTEIARGRHRLDVEVRAATGQQLPTMTLMAGRDGVELV